MNLDKRQEVVEICTLMINSDINLIEGCRKLTSLCEQVDEGENEIFFPIVAIESETDHFPYIIASCDDIINHFKNA